MAQEIEKAKGCPVCGWDAGDAHDPLVHYIKDLDDGQGAPVKPAIHIIQAYRKALADLVALCANRELSSRQKLERIDLRLMKLEREARDAAGKGQR